MTLFRLAILECDTPIDSVRERRGTYGDIFVDILRSALRGVTTHSAVEPVFTSWDVVDKQEYPDLDDVDGILLTGSKHDSFADHEWILKLVEFMRKAHETPRIRLVGICFGHQIIARALNAEVARSSGGWEVAVSNINLSEKGREIFGVESIALHQMHQDAVLSMPDACENLGSSERCGIQGLYRKASVFTTQAHPEFTEDVMQDLLDSRHESGVFDDDLYRDASARSGKEHDGLRVARAIWTFLLE